ncbi:transposase [Actinomadura sp. 6N118]|uniref:transposase n=1 Tax=Actinomadura sp. 6N118 TaxID=3375151 RepID=UPI00378A313C
MWTAPVSPGDSLPWTTVYACFAAWQKDGIFTQLTGLLRRLVRQQNGHDAEPSAAIIDSQSVKSATTVPASTRGFDAGKKIVGRKRNIITDTLGLLVMVLGTAASCATTKAYPSAPKP